MKKQRSNTNQLYGLMHTDLEIIKLFRQRYLEIFQVICFDTAFHATLPHIEKIQPIPRRFDQAGVQKYGFHGPSYAFLVEELKKAIGMEEAKGRKLMIAKCKADLYNEFKSKE
ncbi:hypothetical protein V5097_10050 [Arenibacter palladensis]|uniref:hypothetical protein n=1 Tax=Arenibacter palladensis TaxID=237373 RepID=UPI002FD651B2